MACISALVLNRNPSLFQACVEQLTAVADVRYKLVFEEDEAAFFGRIAAADIDCILFGEVRPGEGDRALIRSIRQRHPLTPVVMLAQTGPSEPEPSGPAKTGRDGQEWPVQSLHNHIQAALDAAGHARQGRRTKNEIARHRSEQPLRLSMHNAPSGIALVDLDMCWLEVNPALCKLLGHAPGELHGTAMTDLVHEREREETQTDFRAILAGRLDTVSKERRLLHKSGSDVSVIFSFSLICSEDAEPMHFILQVMDISERKEMDRLKSEFISIVSHELRTPLTSINGSLGLVLNTQADGLSVFVRELLSVANRNCERLMMLVNDILDIDRISSGQMRFDIRPEPISRLIDQMLEANAAYARRLGVRLVTEDFDRSLTLNVDFFRLIQVLTNFVSNATKFSDPGDKVEIRSQVRKDRIRISVCDHGCGVPVEYEPRMFTRFAQADSSVARKKNGSGLGLYIARQMTEQMGGEVGYHPTKGGGATFWVDVPLADAVVGMPESDGTRIALTN